MFPPPSRLLFWDACGSNAVQGQGLGLEDGSWVKHYRHDEAPV